MEIEQIRIIIYFSSSILIFLLGNYVYLKDPKRTLNKIFFLFSLTATLWGLMYGLLMVIYPTFPLITVKEFIKTKEVFKIFLFVAGNSAGYFLVSLFLHLCLIITEKKEILRKKIVPFIIYFPPTFLMAFLFIWSFVFFKLGKDILTRGVGLFFNIFSSTYFELYLLISVFLLFKRYFALKSSQEKRKLRYLLIGAMIPAVFGSIFTVILSGLFNIQTFDWLTFPFYTVGYIFIAVGVLKYSLFIDYREILETIFKRLSELVIITDKEGIIILTNEITPRKLNFKEEEMIGENISELLEEKEKDFKRIKERLEKEGVFKERISFLTKEKGGIPHLLVASLTKEGIIFVGRDIEELVKYQQRLEEEVKGRTEELERAKGVLEIKVKARTRKLEELTQSLEVKVGKRTMELQKRIDELEKFHRLTTGRELKMVELKREIERLKEEIEKEKPKLQNE